MQHGQFREPPKDAPGLAPKVENPPKPKNKPTKSNSELIGKQSLRLRKINPVTWKPDSK